ncbi:hypothetical protein [Roseibium sp. RKSG952]|uniref:hypothetical protein n=1 Tax=Roseibium sp. RKSG952 TaxID=2529384 RepID=UPI0012BD6089|nr:hypothetical protein [Roseibium sp. RKSG952]MTH95410.1 hypothetical protein [Roseibium sp. RKSG952]
MAYRNDPTADDMHQAVARLGEVLRQPGDNQLAMRNRIADATGLSERTVRAYFHREARCNHPAHLELFLDLAEKANPHNEIERLKARIAQLEALLLGDGTRLAGAQDHRRSGVRDRDTGLAAGFLGRSLAQG